MSGPAETTSSFSGKGGLEIFYRHLPAENETIRLVIAHGLGEHSGRYGNVVDALRPLGVSIWAQDHRGHGQSQGPRGHVALFGDYLDDVGAMIEIARRDPPAGRRLLLLGHSLGGLIALSYAQAHPETIDGVMASSPGLGMKVEVPAVKAVLGKVMSSIYPGLSMSNELDATKISRDPEAVKAYIADPLVHDKVTARFFTEFVGAMEKAQQGAAQMSLPVLMQVAGDDHLVDAQASREFFQKVGSKDKTLKVYDGYYHEIYNEPPDQRARPLGDLADWVKAHTS